MTTKIKINDIASLEKLNVVNRNSGVFVELPIYKDDLLNPYNDSVQNVKAIKSLKQIVEKVIHNLKDDAFLFVYGTPLQLIKFDELVNKKINFHYWIVLDTNNCIEKNSTQLKHSHVGILLYSKNGSLSSLDVKNTRFPHIACSACNNNVKDWGGKKHLMNINGTGLSDVWKDLFDITGVRDDKIMSQIKLNILNIEKSLFKEDMSCPNEVKSRVQQLVGNQNGEFIHIEVSKDYLNKINNHKETTTTFLIKNPSTNKFDNQVILGDCITEMEKLTKKYPDGLFDLVFADPPYNLAKNYKEYDDERSAIEYEKWCNTWIELCVKLTKPSGSIFLLNIPKWGLSHARTLNKIAYFRNWIVWDALSTPKGKIMPAHYSLLYYTKSDKSPTFNNGLKIDPISYCIRNTCQRTRSDNESYLNDKIEISDVWHDIHRIKHKKDRDDHPCQLPHKLMDRIIQMFSNTDELVFDPFGGAGTTGICALKNGRKFLLTEVDPYYKKMSEKRISETLKTGDTIRLPSKKMIRSKYTKKFLETKVQELSLTLNRKPTLNEFVDKYRLELGEIEKIYPEPNRVLKAGRISLLNRTI